MATHRSCDGCGARETPDAPFAELGTIKKRDYCGTCAPVIEAYIKSRDELHDRVADEWRAGMQTLIGEVRLAHPDMALPDVE